MIHIIQKHIIKNLMLYFYFIFSYVYILENLLQCIFIIFILSNNFFQVYPPFHIDSTLYPYFKSNPVKLLESSSLEYVSPTSRYILKENCLSLSQYQSIINHFMIISMQCLSFVWHDFVKVLYTLSQLLTFHAFNCSVIFWKPWL